MSSGLLITAESSGALDAEAGAEWGFNSFSLVEAAGRGCAQVFAEAFPALFSGGPKVAVAAGSGNNGADAMVMLRYWILKGLVTASASALILNRLPGGEGGPRSELIKSLKKMGVPVFVWGEDTGTIDAALAGSGVIVDGIAGTGLRGPLRGAAREMAEAVNALRDIEASRERPFVVSVDFPSGNFDRWEPGMPIVKADLTLAIEPRKYCMYTPAARPCAGNILPVDGVFPGELIARYGGARLLDWESARREIPEIPPDAYKNERGTVEIHAGSPGATGAAQIAARGAQAAGAGLVRLVADDEIYPILASQCAGVMVAPVGIERNRAFPPDAILLGPGWGVKPARALVLENALALEKTGIPLVLDADAILLARDKIFGGNVILTPHPGELSAYTGIDRDELLRRPAPVLREFAGARNAIILFKSHVITIAAPDGRLGVVDGMKPGLAAGGSGDLLAGFCAAIAARMKRGGRGVDLFNCAAAAASLLIAAGSAEETRSRFTDPMELADKAADIAGKAWLGSSPGPLAPPSQGNRP